MSALTIVVPRGSSKNSEFLRNTIKLAAEYHHHDYHITVAHKRTADAKAGIKCIAIDKCFPLYEMFFRELNGKYTDEKVKDDVLIISIHPGFAFKPAHDKEKKKAMQINHLISPFTLDESHKVDSKKPLYEITDKNIIFMEGYSLLFTKRVKDCSNAYTHPRDLFNNFFANKEIIDFIEECDGDEFENTFGDVYLGKGLRFAFLYKDATRDFYVSEGYKTTESEGNKYYISNLLFLNNLFEMAKKKETQSSIQFPLGSNKGPNLITKPDGSLAYSSGTSSYTPNKYGKSSSNRGRHLSNLDELIIAYQGVAVNEHNYKDLLLYYKEDPNSPDSRLTNKTVYTIKSFSDDAHIVFISEMAHPNKVVAIHGKQLIKHFKVFPKEETREVYDAYLNLWDLMKHDVTKSSVQKLRNAVRRSYTKIATISNNTGLRKFVLKGQEFHDIPLKAIVLLFNDYCSIVNESPIALNDEKSVY